MIDAQLLNTNLFAALLEGERARLVRLCAAITSDSQAAEDLAQETLLIAWRKRDQLHDPSGVAPWLSAIARNVCRHWLRRRQRAPIDMALPITTADHAPSALDDALADTFDLEVELERDELALLLDRALALLPNETRAALVQHYIEELPQAELAARFGISAGALAVRLHRGKLALKRILATDLHADALAYGLVEPTSDSWQETRMWCPHCGCRKLLGKLDPATGEFYLHCVCISNLVNARTDFLKEMKSFKPAFSRLSAWVHEYYIVGARAGMVDCQGCGRPLRLRIGDPPQLPNFPNSIYAWCDHCAAGPGAEGWSSLTRSLPEVRQFWQENPRMRQLPERSIEADGSPALVIGFEDIAGSARIEVVWATSTFEPIRIHRT